MRHHPLWPALCGASLLGTALLAMACNTALPAEIEERDDPAPDQTLVEEPIEFTSEPYPDELRGELGIAELREITLEAAGSTRVWSGFAADNDYPVAGECDAFGQDPGVIDELPAVLEGVVTLHPRFFDKPSVCATDERFYGSFFLEDATGGIFVLRDSRIATFTYGDRVRLTVQGVRRNFDYVAVTSISELEVVTGEERVPISYRPLEREFEDADQGEVVQIEGEVVSEATNNNFNELELQSLDDPEVSWLVSLDRELGQRAPDLGVGKKVRMKGPVINDFGLRIIVASYGQIEWLEDTPRQE